MRSERKMYPSTSDFPVEVCGYTGIIVPAAFVPCVFVSHVGNSPAVSHCIFILFVILICDQ